MKLCRPRTLLRTLSLLRTPPGHCLGTPKPYNLSKKCCSTPPFFTVVRPPVYNAVPCWLLSFEEREMPQYTFNLYCSTPPICTAVGLPFVPAMLLRKYQCLGFRKAPDLQAPSKNPSQKPSLLRSNYFQRTSKEPF